MIGRKPGEEKTEVAESKPKAVKSKSFSFKKKYLNGFHTKLTLKNVLSYMQKANKMIKNSTKNRKKTFISFQE